jgi:hypothetical protein
MASRITVYDNKLFLSGEGSSTKWTQPIFVGGHRKLELKVIAHGLAIDNDCVIVVQHSAYNDPYDATLWTNKTPSAGTATMTAEGVTTLEYDDPNAWIKLGFTVQHDTAPGANLNMGVISASLTMYEEK